MSEELTFEFEGEIITALDADTTEPVFVASPVARKLGHPDATHMLRGLDPDEKGLHIVETLGGPQEMSVITLPGLIHAFNNRRPGAIKDETMRGMVIRFQRWVNHEVIPSILKHGRYELPNRHLLEAGHHERMRQVELLKASQGLVHPDFLEAKTRIVIARELGEAPELDPKTRPLYTQDYLRGKNLGSRRLKSVAPTFGKRLKKLYVEHHGREPMKQDMTLPTGRIIKACAYTEADRPLFDEVWKQFDPNTGVD